TPRLYNGKETITLKPTSTDYVYKIESAGNGNSYVLSTKMKPGYWSRTSSGWKPVSREGRNDVAYCEFVTKYAKSFIPGEQQMPAQLYQYPIGDELEIIPLSDISRFGEDVKLKVLYKTSPLAGATLELDSVSYLKSSRHTHAAEHKHSAHKAELTFVSNEDGIITVPSLHVGQWLAKVKNKKVFQDKNLCDETVDVATLSFSRN
ncbi:DUF4198 domain-containing protein, partial [Escherichia coli]|nr:DUF4198 domain-containing protein [Escherichia coli]